jgi:CBS domain-containing protein
MFRTVTPVTSLKEVAVALIELGISAVLVVEEGTVLESCQKPTS